MRYDFKVENLADVRDKLARDIARVAGIISITLSLVATIALASTQSSNLFSSDSNAVENLLESDYADSETTDESWVPAGFTVWWEDSNIAWKWTTDSVNYEGCDDCIYWIVDVVSKNGCPSGVYGSLNISRGDVTLDWTNDTVPYLGPMETARLAFEKYGYDDAGSNYQGDLTTLNCR
jgi:hypothetical protein